MTERLAQAELPAGLEPEIGADFSPVGEIYFYTLRSTNPRYDLMELKTLDEWVVHKQLLSVPNVVEVAGIGGITREYQVRIDPDKLVSYGLSLSEVEEQLSGQQQQRRRQLCRGRPAASQRPRGRPDAQCGRHPQDSHQDPEWNSGARSAISRPSSREPRSAWARSARRSNGPTAKSSTMTTLSRAVCFCARARTPRPTLKAIHAKVQEINEHILPPGVKIVPFLDRSDLIHHTTRTVLRNLTEGFILVSVVLFLFLGNARSAMIVALTIPFSLLFASICLDLRHIPANLLSLGALDFGMVVDGAVVMVENIVRHLSSREDAERSFRTGFARPRTKCSGRSSTAITIIITAYLPIFTLQKVEGRMFRPMAWTVAFALLGALTFSILVGSGAGEYPVPQGLPRSGKIRCCRWMTSGYRRALTWTVHHRWVMVGAAARPRMLQPLSSAMAD